MPESLQYNEPIDPEARPISPADMAAEVPSGGLLDPRGDVLDIDLAEAEARERYAAEEAQAEAERQAELERGERARIFMQVARERFRESADASNAVRARMVSDMRFSLGGDEQWMIGGKNYAAVRRENGRPAHTVNRVPGFVKQVTNGIRESRTGIEFIPVDDESDPDTAEVLQGLVRHVEQNSMADIAYETAMEHQVRSGLGWFFARTEYVHDGTDEQEIVIDRVRNPFTVYWDPASQKWDFSDARYLFRIEDVPLATYQRLYGQKASIASLEEFQSIGDHASNWRIKDRVRIADYYYIEHETRELVAVQYMSGRVERRFKDELSQGDPNDPPVGGVKLRDVQVPRVKWAKINGLGVIDGNEDLTEGRLHPGRYIPFAPVIGDETDVDGEIDYRGMVRDLRDAQSMVNFWQSAITEAIALAPRAPFIISEGQIGEYAHYWNSANDKSWSHLPYKAESLDGHLVPPPQRNVMEPAIQAMVTALQIAENHLRALAGFYDVQPKDRSQEQSGRAILARQQQGERGNGHFHGNLSRAIRHMGRILLHMFPVVYDTKRVKRIMGADENERDVVVYAGEKNKPKAPVMKRGQGAELKAFDLSVGRYDVRTSVGPSYPTRRQQGLEMLTELAKVNPLVGQAGADIIVGMVDAPGARELAKRLKKVPQVAQLLEQDSGDPQARVMQLQAQLEQMGGLIEQLTKELNAKSAVLETEATKHEAQERIKRLELASREAIAFQQGQVELMRIRAGLEQQEIRAQTEGIKAQLAGVQAVLTQAFGQSHEEHMREVDATREREAAAMQSSAQMQEGGGAPQGPDAHVVGEGMTEGPGEGMPQIPAVGG